MQDDIDRVPLRILQRDGQIPYTERGGHVGLSASAVKDRLKRLNGKGVLPRTTAEVFSAREPEFPDRMRARPEGPEGHPAAGRSSWERFLPDAVESRDGRRRTRSIIARPSDTTVPGTGQ